VLGSCLYISIQLLLVRCYIVLCLFYGFLVVLCWVVDCCEFVIVCEVICFMFLILLRKYNYCFFLCLFLLW
jgi:hypothetical protein